MTVDEVVAAHCGAGREFSVGGVRSFALDQGLSDAEPVVCLHGVPASSFVCRAVRSLLLLNTMVAVDTFRPPWVMEPFEHRFLGRAWLATAQAPLVFPRS